MMTKLKEKKKHLNDKRSLHLEVFIQDKMDIGAALTGLYVGPTKKRLLEISWFMSTMHKFTEYHTYHMLKNQF